MTSQVIWAEKQACFLILSFKRAETSEGCGKMLKPWQLCRTIGPLMLQSQEIFKIASHTCSSQTASLSILAYAWRITDAEVSILYPINTSPTFGCCLQKGHSEEFWVHTCVRLTMSWCFFYKQSPVVSYTLSFFCYCKRNACMEMASLGHTVGTWVHCSL